MSFKIPLFKLNFDEQEENAVVATLRSKWISTGPKCKELENLFCDSLTRKYGLTVSSATSALHLAMKTLKIGPGDEVIVPSLTFAATANCVKYVGAKVVFADVVSYDNLNIDPDDIERKITENTKAIIPVHYGGFPCNMDRIMQIAEKYNLKVVEDASHGPLSEYKGQKLGAIGHISCFSFFSNKNLSPGEGGMFITNNEEYFNTAKLLRSHGMTTMSYERAKGHATVYDIQSLGYNYRLDDIRATIGIVQFGKLKEDYAKRENVRKQYIKELSDIKEIIIPFKDNEEYVSNYIMPIVLKDSSPENRDALREHLHKNGIQTSVHYPSVHKFSIYHEKNNHLPITDYVVDNEITLPMFGDLTNDDIHLIVNTIKSFYTN